MHIHRAGVFALAAVALSSLWADRARADVRFYEPTQTLARPAGQTYTTFGDQVAIDNGHLIVLARYEGGLHALLYRKSRSGQWVFRRVLVTWNGAFVRTSIAMRNGIAAVQIDDQISLFEMSGGDYVRQTSAAPIRHHGGVAISGRSVLIGGNNCDYDAVIYEKTSGGSWAITGRLDDNVGDCLEPWYNTAVELHYDYAIIRPPSGLTWRGGSAWRRNGTAVDWLPAGTLPFLPDEGATNNGVFALQGATAVAPNGIVWRRSGSSAWTRESEIRNVSYYNQPWPALDPEYRDGVLLAAYSTRFGGGIGVFEETSPGEFEHLGTLRGAIGSYDVSGRTVVGGGWTYTGTPNYIVQVFDLPTPLRAPAPLVNDFEDRNVADFSFSGGQFGVAARGTNDVLAQSASTGLALAVMTDSDWNYRQRVEADITPTIGPGGWVGLVARYVDADNYYYLRIRDNDTYGFYKRVNGVDTLLHEAALYDHQQPTFRAMLDVSGNQITANFGFQTGATVTDDSLAQGRAGVATFMARADFDDVHVTSTDRHVLFEREWGFGGSDYEMDMEALSGDWAVLDDGDPENVAQTGLWQRDASGSAVAITGMPVPNVEITARMRLVSYAASQQGAWFGLLARYVDARNHYYVTVRSTGQIQIRKIVDGVITVLASANFTPVPYRYFEVKLVVIDDQLHLYLEHVRVASAHDRSLTSGRYGLATYRAAANWDRLWVLQP